MTGVGLLTSASHIRRVAIVRLYCLVNQKCLALLVHQAAASSGSPARRGNVRWGMVSS